MHKPVPPGTVCVKNIFRTGHLLPKSATCFKKIDFNVFFFIEIIYFLCHFNELRHPNRINKSLKDF